jgi:hypothetical protein
MQLVVNFLDVRPHCVVTDIQFVTNIFLGHSANHAPQKVHFPFAQVKIFTFRSIDLSAGILLEYD